MSIRVYRLLRNNKEEGPFTAEELIQKNLRPYDLIWIDGRSAGWSYPGELAQFKKYAPLPGDENTRESGKIQPSISPSVQAAVAINNNISQAKEKPRYKVSAAWSKIQTLTAATVNNIKPDNEKKSVSKKPMVVSHSTGIPSKSLSWEEAWQDWENQKDHEPAPVKPVTKRPANNKESEPILETKYAEPLDSLKDKYIENILQQKQKSKRSISAGKVGEFVLPAIALLVIFSAAYWLLNDTEVPALNTASVEQQQPPPVSNTNTSPEPVNINTAKQEEPVKVEQEKTPAAITGIPEHAAERKNNKIRLSTAGISTYIDKDDVKSAGKKVTEVVASQPKANTKKAEMPATPQIKNVISNTNTVPKNNDNNVKTPEKIAEGNINAGTTVARPVTEDIKPKAPVKKVTADYVNAPGHVELTNGIANIKIENISNIDFDLVVVDVQYYSPYNSFRKGETLYLHNLKAGKNVVIKTPKDSGSAYATSKISLISSDAKQLYVVGEN